VHAARTIMPNKGDYNIYKVTIVCNTMYI